MASKRPVIGTVIAGIGGGRDITRGYVAAQPQLPPQDPLIGGMEPAGRYRLYRGLLKDDRVHTAFQQRRSALVGREFQVEPGGKRRVDRAAADFVRDALAALPWDDIVEKQLYSVIYGLGVAECVWRRDGRHIVPSEIRVRDRSRFCFGGGDGMELRLLTASSPQGEPMPPRKFWTVTYGADHADDPYGDGLGSRLYWPVWFKRNGVTFWSDFLDRFASPIPVVKYARAEDRDAAVAAVEAFRTAGGLALAKSMEHELMSPSRGGTADYSAWTEYWDTGITLTLIGQTMTTEDGSSRSQAEVHWEVRRDLVQADDDLLAASMRSQFLRWMCDWSYPGAAVPRVRRVLDDPPDTNELSERDERIFRMGWRPTQTYIGDTYGVDTEAIAPPPDGGDGGEDPVQFAEDGIGPARRPLGAETAAAAGPIVDAWVGRLRARLDGAESLAEYRDWLAGDAAGALQVQSIEGVLGAVFVLAYAAGWADAEDGAEAAVEFADGGARQSFVEQIDFFRNKIALSTESWSDIVHDQHDKAFVVAGAMGADLVNDLRVAVEKAIADGETLATFRRRFDGIIARRGWSFKGNRDWRARVIYQTNLRASYAAGRHEQMLSVANLRPYWRYRHSHASVNPREQHVAWDGLILHHEDPWWDTHSTPNGWGCNCYKESLSEADLERHGKSGPDTAPPIVLEEVLVGARGPNPRRVLVPKGVDPGWGYPPGRSVAQRRQEGRYREELGESEWGRLRNSPGTRAGLNLGLTVAETVSVVDYTGGRYMLGNQQMIRALGGPDAELPGGAHLPWALTLRSALRALPDRPGTTWRRTSVPPEVLQKYQPGAVNVEEFFLSTSKLENPPFPGDVLFEIRGRAGKDIETISLHGPTQREVLFNAYTRFRVVSRDNDYFDPRYGSDSLDSLIRIVLEEVTDDG